MTAAGPSPLAGEEINLRAAGSPQAPALVLIHGLDSAWQTFENVIGELARDYYVIAYDQRGHGQTPARGLDYSSAAMAADLEALLDHLGLGRVHLLGHSMGARTAVAFAAAHPARVLSLTIEDMELQARAPAFAGSHREAVIAEHRALAQLFAERSYPDRAALSAVLERIYSPEAAASVIGRRAVERPDGSWELLYRPEIGVLYSAAANADDLLEGFVSVPAPALVLRADSRYGSAISEQGWQLMCSRRPAARYVELAECGHTIHRSCPERFLEALSAFLASG